MPDRHKLTIDRHEATHLLGDVEQAKAILERWLVESTPAADGIDWEQQPDGRWVAIVWRWEGLR